MMDNTNMTLAQRLHAIQGEISYIKKRPKENLPYPYVSHDDVSEALRGLFIKHGVLALPEVRHERQEGNRCVLDISVTLVNVDNPEERLEVSGVGHGVDNQDKGPGKAYSYAYKMIMLKLFQIPTGEKDVEQDQIEQTYLPEGMVRKVIKAIDSKDGIALMDLMENQPDNVQLAVWRELNMTAKNEARALLKETREAVASNTGPAI